MVSKLYRKCRLGIVSKFQLSILDISWRNFKEDECLSSVKISHRCNNEAFLRRRRARPTCEINAVSIFRYSKLHRSTSLLSFMFTKIKRSDITPYAITVKWIYHSVTLDERVSGFTTSMILVSNFMTLSIHRWYNNIRTGITYSGSQEPPQSSVPNFKVPPFAILYHKYSPVIQTDSQNYNAQRNRPNDGQ